MNPTLPSAGPGDRDRRARRLAAWLESSGQLARRRDELRRCRRLVRRRKTRDLPRRFDPDDLAVTGWGLIHPRSVDPAVLAALEPLLEHRRRRAGDLYRRLVYGGEETDQPLADEFLWDEHGAAPGVIDVRKLPYYLLLVGGPEEIPFEVQYQLSIDRAVGRLCFDDPAAYRAYAEAVVRAERRGVDLPRRWSVFSVEHDRTTRRLARHFVRPLRARLGREIPLWQGEIWDRQAAEKASLLARLAEAPPALLLAACHGLRLPPGELEEQQRRQGALICQDSPGSGRTRPEHCLHGGDLPPELRLDGLIAMLFACYGAGTPVEDGFPHEAEGATLDTPPGALALAPFVARLPQEMLKRGALAVLGHVDRGWTLSFSWVLQGKPKAAIENLEEAVRELFAGRRIGHALRPLARRYAVLGAHLAAELEHRRFGEPVDAEHLAMLWTAHNDARNFVILGDPAVRLLGDGRTGGEALPATPAPAAAAPEPGTPSAPDLEIVTRVAREAEALLLSYEVTAAEDELGLNQHRFGPVRLHPDHEGFFAEVFAVLRRLPEDPELAAARLADSGQNLAAELLPADLRSLLRRLWHEGRVETVVIQSSDEIWLPWELMKLWSSQGEASDGPFLAEAFALTRWRTGVGRGPRYLPLRRLALVFGHDPELEALAGERQAILALASGRRRVETLAPLYRVVRQALRSGGYDGLHFGGHGRSDRRHPNLWSIVLEDAELTPEVLTGRVAAGLGRRRPLVFWNACHSGEQARALTGVGGWAARFLEAGAGAFVGTLWAVEDAPARVFAESFYRRFLGGEALGAAVREARREVRRRFPGNPSWLAYTVFGHPLARAGESPRRRRWWRKPGWLAAVAVLLLALAIGAWYAEWAGNRPVPSLPAPEPVETVAGREVPPSQDPPEARDQQPPLPKTTPVPPPPSASQGQSTRAVPEHDVVLVLPSTMAGAEIRVDGQPATIVKNLGDFVTIRVAAKATNHHLEVRKGERVCSQEILIGPDTRRLQPCDL